jgi:hypothetical protein
MSDHPKLPRTTSAAQADAAVTRARDFDLELTPDQGVAVVEAAREALAAGLPPVLAVNAAAARLYPLGHRVADDPVATGRLMENTMNVLMAASAVDPTDFEILPLRPQVAGPTRRQRAER